MSDRVVVYSTSADADAVDRVADSLRSQGVELIEQQPHMLLVTGTKDAISRLLGKTHGWGVTELSTVPPPRTRQRIVKGPS
jgi:hypothetical protein